MISFIEKFELERFEPISFSGSNNDCYGANIDHFFSSSLEKVCEKNDEVDWSSVDKTLSRHMSSTLDSYQDSDNPSLQMRSLTSTSIGDNSLEDTDMYWNLPRYNVEAQSDSLVSGDSTMAESPRSSNFSTPDKRTDSDSDNDAISMFSESSESEKSYKGRNNCKEKKKRTTKKKSTKSSPSGSTKQNNKKNIPGLIAQKVKAFILANHPFYIKAKERLCLLARYEKDLKKFADSYNKQHKTWTAITKFLSKNHVLGIIYLDLINLLLSEENKDFFEEWAENGKMNEKTKQILVNEKQFFVDKFENLLSDNQLEGDGLEEKTRKRRKTN